MGTLLAINGEVINSQEPLPIPINYEYLGETTGNATIDIPEEYSEVFVDIQDVTGNNSYTTTFATVYSSKSPRGGYYFNSSNCGGWAIAWNNSTRKANLTSVVYNGTNNTSTAKAKWYGIKTIIQSIGGNSRRLAITITADGVKTFGDVLAAMTPYIGEITVDSYISYSPASNVSYIIRPILITDTYAVFSFYYSVNDGIRGESLTVRTNSNWTNINHNTVTDVTSTVFSSGYSISLYI